MDDTKRQTETKGKTAKLTAVERAFIMTLLAEGHTVRDVSDMAAKEGIVISYQNVAKYKKKIEPKTAEIIEKVAAIYEKKEISALKQGIAIKENRVQKLADMEALMYESIRQRVANGYSVEALIREWRGLLDDVAKEMGDRRNVNNNTINVNNNTIHIVEHANALLEKTYGETIDGSCTDTE